jgi:phosphoribosylformimino-5-aminoimidazole carboxamide ribotide isomerase
MTMEIFPAIDLQNGQCVRLVQGDFNAAKVYETDPLVQALRFADAGARWLHIVDLNGARAGKPMQFDVIAAVAKQKILKVQVGGGIRDEGAIERLLDEGVERVVLGSLAVNNPALVRDWLGWFGPARIVLAFDVRMNEKNEPEVLTQGWQHGSKMSLWDILTAYADSDLKTILCTDVARDGMMTGANHAFYRDLRKRWPSLEILASGGIKDQNDLLALAPLGVAGAVVGKAIYEGRIDLALALKALKGQPHAG